MTPTSSPGIVETPDGSTGVALRGFGGTTSELTVVNDGNEQKNGNAGFGEGGLNDQRFFTDGHPSIFPTAATYEATSNLGVGSLVGGLSYSALIADQPGGNGDTSLSPDGHSVQTQDDSGLLQGKGAALAKVIVNHDSAIHPIIGIGRAVIGESAVGVSNFDISRDLATPGGDGTISDLEVLELKQFPLHPFMFQSRFWREGNGLEHTSTFVSGTSSLSQDEDQQNQTSLQDHPSFGSLTLPPDCDVVNPVGAFATGFVGLTADQLGLLNKATITIVDLADGYLALTFGTAITLDGDAASGKIDLMSAASTLASAKSPPRLT